MEIKIKRNYYDKTKEILKKIKPYHYVVNFFILLQTKDNKIKNCFIYWYYENEIIKIELPIIQHKGTLNKEFNNTFEIEYLNEIIESLTDANRQIYFKLKVL